jgi:uncharacterized membrane protein
LAAAALRETGDATERLFRHLMLPHWWVRACFPPGIAAACRAGGQASESVHRGELRVVVEGNLPLPGLWRGQSARARAIDLFSQLRVWDTEHNSGVLIYLQLIDRRVEIVADRGIDRQGRPEFWDGVSAGRWKTPFRAGDFEKVVRAGADGRSPKRWRTLPGVGLKIPTS